MYMILLLLSPCGVGSTRSVEVVSLPVLVVVGVVAVLVSVV